MASTDRPPFGDDLMPRDPLLMKSSASGPSRNRSSLQTRFHETGERTPASPAGRIIPVLSREQLKLRNTLLLAQELQGVRSVLVTGTDEGVGTTAVAAALALGLCLDSKKEALLIDANTQRPELHKLFRLSTSNSLTATAGGAGFLEMADVVGMPNLRVIASPGRGGGFTFDTKRFVAVMPALHEAFDFLIVDAPPLALNPEVMPLCLHFHSVILVAEAERTRIHELQEVTRELGTAKAKLLGVVLNRQKDNLPATFKKWV